MRQTDVSPLKRSAISWMSFLFPPAEGTATSGSKTDELAFLLNLQVSIRMLNTYNPSPCSKEPFQKTVVNKCLGISQLSFKITITF